MFTNIHHRLLLNSAVKETTHTYLSDVWSDIFPQGLTMPKYERKNQQLLEEMERMAADTFQTKAEAAQWLHTPHPMLEGKMPLQVAETPPGAERVRQILVAIKYGFSV